MIAWWVTVPTLSAEATGANGALDGTSSQDLLDVAHEALEYAVRERRRIRVPVARMAPPLQERRGSFVTLMRYGELRGCIGSLEGRSPLAQGVADHSYAAALEDPRFDPVAMHELVAVRIELSVLSPLEPLEVSSERELLARVRPFRDGLVIDDGCHRATFLPKVWETLPDPEDFLRHLKIKAGIALEAWPAQMRVLRYECKCVADQSLERTPQSS